jgi:hypothetical protein
MPPAWARRAGVAAAALALVACASPGPRIERGTFRVPERFRISVPGPQWEAVSEARADLELRHHAGDAGLLANAECGGRHARADLRGLTRRLFVGFRGREVLETGVTEVAGLPAAHAVVEGRVTGEERRVRVEAFIIKTEGCVYDLVYVAPTDAFAERRPDFERFVASFVKE